MAKARVKAARSMPTKARVRTRVTAAALPASLPPQATPATLSTLPVRAVQKKERVYSGKSAIRQKVLLILGMRLQGKSNDEISGALGLTPGSINQYMYLAGKHGWLKKDAVDPTDRLTHELSHKVVRNLDEMLDSDDEDRRDHATLKTAEGMLFPRFKEQQQVVAPMTMLGVKIEMSHAPGTALPTVREGTTGGEPLWKEGEVQDGTGQHQGS